MTRVLHSFGLRGRSQGCKYTVAHGKAKRRGMQNLKGFAHYFTEAEWNDILNGEATVAAKLD